MKKQNLSIYLAFMSTFFIFSCHKVTVPVTEVRIAKYITGNFAIVYTYDGQKRVIKEEHLKNDIADGYKKTYDYSEADRAIEREPRTTINVRNEIVFELDAVGKVVRSYPRDPTGNVSFLYNTWRYLYNVDLQVTEINYVFTTVGDYGKVVYTYSNGNLIKVLSVFRNPSGIITDTRETVYEYNSEIINSLDNGNYGRGYLGKGSKNACTREIETGIYNSGANRLSRDANYSYEVDQEGLITKRKTSGMVLENGVRLILSSTESFVYQ